MKRILAAITSCLALSACGTKDSSKKSNETPQKTAQEEIDYSSVVGYLKIKESFCTFYASDTKDITTAYHCLDANGQGDIYEAEDIKLYLANGQQLSFKAIKTLLPKKDLAVVEIEESFDSFLQQSDLDETKQIQLVSYDQDKQSLSQQDQCRFDKQIPVAGVFTYSCETEGHYSGSPMIQDQKVVGMHLGYKKKIDRRVALDFRLINQDSDVLEVAFKQEGCHTRAHVRGGVIDGHSRFHSRGCSPAELFREYILGIKNEVQVEKDDTAEVIALIKEDNVNHQRLQGSVNTAWNKFMECYDDAKASRDREKALNCQATFKSEMDAVIGELKVIMDQKAGLQKDRLTDRAREYVDTTHRISGDIVEMWTNFKSCLISVGNYTTIKDKNSRIKVCWVTMKERITSITIDIDALASDPFVFD